MVWGYGLSAYITNVTLCNDSWLFKPCDWDVWGLFFDDLGPCCSGIIKRLFGFCVLSHKWGERFARPWVPLLHSVIANAHYCHGAGLNNRLTVLPDCVYKYKDKLNSYRSFLFRQLALPVTGFTTNLGESLTRLPWAWPMKLSMVMIYW